MYYCIISLCSSNGMINVEGSVGCYLYKNSVELRNRLMDHWFMDPTPEDPYRTICPEEGDDGYENKVEYINHVMSIADKRQDEIHHFPRLSLNSSCCEVFLYCTNHKSKIIYDSRENTYVILTKEELDTLYGR